MSEQDDIAAAINRLAEQMATLPGGKPDWVHNFQGKCSANCPCASWLPGTVAAESDVDK
jgi:hypothetical protein